MSEQTKFKPVGPVTLAFLAGYHAKDEDRAMSEETFFEDIITEVISFGDGSRITIKVQVPQEKRLNTAHVVWSIIRCLIDWPLFVVMLTIKQKGVRLSNKTTR